MSQEEDQGRHGVVASRVQLISMESRFIYDSMGEIKYELKGFLMIREGSKTEYHLVDDQGRRILVVDPIPGVLSEKFYNGSTIQITIKPGPAAPTTRQE